MAHRNDTDNFYRIIKISAFAFVLLATGIILYIYNNGFTTNSESENISVVHSNAENKKPLITLEQKPEFPGGESAMIKYIQKNLVYPLSAEQKGIEGRVEVSFVIQENGEINDISIIRGIDPVCDREVIRIVENMPEWVSAKHYKPTVPVRYTLPVVFKLDSIKNTVNL